jgi:hypothetical protein
MSAKYRMTSGRKAVMTGSPLERDPVERLVDEFVWRCRRGEVPSISEYIADYPQYAGQIEQLFPTVAMMEQLRIEEMKRRAAIRPSQPRSPPKNRGDVRTNH